MNRIRMAIAAVALLGATSAVTTAAAAAQTIQVNKDDRVIALSATGNAKADADIARVRIGFQVFARDADSAYAKGSQTSNAIAVALRKAGVDDKSIESENESVGRNDEFVPFRSAWDESKKQFTVQQSWTVTTAPRDAARVLHAAVQAGANNSGNIDWDLADRDALGAKAAAKALEKAQAAASEMASALHVSLKGLIYASNQANRNELGDAAGLYGYSRGVMKQMLVAPLAINPRHIEESATVYAVFAIE